MKTKLIHDKLIIEPGEEIIMESRDKSIGTFKSFYNESSQNYELSITIEPENKEPQLSNEIAKSSTNNEG